MRIPSISIFCVLGLAGIFGSVTARAAPAQESRSEAQLAEDQALLKRQLARLRQTMEVLAKRFEDEGRTHAATLLRDGLKQLDTRPEELGAKTLEELMAAAQENLEGGRSVQSIEAQEAAVRSLERLYSILTDRRGLEDLQQSLAKLQELRKELGALADAESKLRESTNALRERSATPAQRALQEALARAQAAQRSLLERTQAEARASSDLDLAALERELEALLADQKADAGVLAAWDPKERAALEAAARAAEQAASPSADAQRLAQAASELRAAAQTARTAGSDLNEAQRALERSAEREERHARTAGEAAQDPAAERAPANGAPADSAAKRAAEALAKGAEAVHEAALGRDSRESAAAKLEAEARALEAEARAESDAARDARQAAEDALAKLADPHTAAGSAASAAREALKRAQAAAGASAAPAAKPGEPAEGQPSANPSPEAAEKAAQAALEAQRATQEAARALQAGLDDMRRVAPILARSQRSAAERAEKLAQAARNMPGEGAPEREAAAAELEAAARAQTESADAAESERADKAAASAAQAQAALERAQAAVQAARAARAQSGAQASAQQALQAEQEALAQETEALEQAAESAGLEEGAQRAAEEALKAAVESMRKASSQMGANRPSEASNAQAKALEKLQEASEAAQSGVRPQTPEDKAEAERQRDEQARIRAELLKLAEKNRQREGAKPSNSMESAARSSQRAEDELSDGDLSEAEEAEAETERKLREAERELGQEEEQYQRLRQEELLFKIAEQVKTLTEEHQAQMRATVELDAQRKPGERPSHSARLRLGKIGKAEEQLGVRATEIAQAIRAEQSLVFAEMLDQVARDLGSIARDQSEQGEWQSGERVQSRQQDVEQALAWLAESLQQEKQRRQQEQQQQSPPQQGQQPANRLVPDVAELKLLRRVGVDVTEDIERIRILHPEIEEGGEIDDLLREDIARLGYRHERVSALFRQFRERLGIPAPSEDKP